MDVAARTKVRRAGVLEIRGRAFPFPLPYNFSKPRKQRRVSQSITLPREPKALAEKLLKQLGDRGAKAVAAALTEMMG